MSQESMDAQLKIALIGIGGFGMSYIPTLLGGGQEHGFVFVGGADPYAERSGKLTDLNAAGVPVHASIESLFAQVTPDLTIISTPISLHATQAAYALSHGSHVLCEKPIAATPADANVMKAARDATGRHVAIGYQWSFSAAIQALKADALAGVFGKLKRMRTVVLWPRDEAYYARNDWAGAIRNPRGDWVLDSPVNNACAHHLHNMLYVAGDTVDRSATPIRVAAELYRANPIQNFDTAALRVELAGGGEALLFVTHAGQHSHHPVFVLEYEHATIETADEPDAHIIATFADGRVKDYGTPSVGYRDEKLWQTIDAIRTGRPSICGIEAAMPHCQVVWACQQASERIQTFARDQLRVVGSKPHRLTTVPDIDEVLLRCFAHSKLPSELGIAWSVPAASVPVASA